MNEIIAPGKNVFTFTITGTILVVARPTMPRLNSYASSPTSSGAENEDSDPEPIVLPRFTVLAADSESTSTIVRNEINGAPATIEVYNSTGDIYRDAQARKTVLQKGGFTKCTEEGARIALRSIGMTSGHINGNGRLVQPPSRPRTPPGNVGALPRVPSNSSFGRILFPSRPKRDGPLMIPSVVASVMPLLREGDLLPNAYAVRVCLNAPSDTDSEWLEFGLAQPGSSHPISDGKDGKPPRVVIISVTVEGIPVKHDTIATAKPEASGAGVAFEEISGKEWISWVRVHVGVAGSGAVVVDYVVSKRKGSKAKDKAKARDEAPLNVLLPSFSVPVGRLEVNIDGSSTKITSLKANFVHQHSTTTGSKLLNYSMEQFFYPQVSMIVRPKLPTPNAWKGTSLLVLATWALVAACLFVMHRLNNEIQRMGRVMENYSTVVAPGWNDVPEPVTITTTVYTSTGTKWRFAADPTSACEPPTPTLRIPVTNAIPESTDAQTNPVLLPSETHSDHETVVSSDPPETTPTTERYALIPIQRILTFSWPAHDFHSTMEKVMHTIDKVWQIFRKVYHYPLDPT